MTDPDSLQRKINDHLSRLKPEQQQQVLDFVEKIAPEGISGKALLPFAGTIDAEDLALMSKAIEEACERISADEW